MKNYKEFNAEVLNSTSLSSGTYVDLQLANKKNEPMNIRVQNASGYEQQITTLTTILAEVVEEKMYSDNLADFVTVSTEGGWDNTIAFWREASVGDLDGAFSDNGGRSGESDNIDVEKDMEFVKVGTWRKGYNIGIDEMNQVMASGNRSIITSKESAYQRIKNAYMTKKAMIGSAGHKGLLNADGLIYDTTTMPTDISEATQAQLNNIFSDMYAAYRLRNEYTADADTLVVPAVELTKLARIYSEFNAITVIEVVRKVMREVTGNPNFNVVSSRYFDIDNNLSGATKNAYMLLNKASVKFHVTVDMDMIEQKGFDLRAEKLLRTSEVYITRPLEVLGFYPVA